MTNALVFSHQGLGDMLINVGLVRHLRKRYSRVIVMAKGTCYTSNVKLFYADDPDIIVLDALEELGVKNIAKLFGGAAYEKTKKIRDRYLIKQDDCYFSGLHRHGGMEAVRKHGYIPLGWYRDLGLPIEAMQEFHVPRSKESARLLALAEKLGPYTFIHSSCSKGSCAEEINRSLKQSGHQELPRIDPNRCQVKKDNPLYEVLQALVGHPVAHYLEVIQNARCVAVVNSCFFCFASQIKCQADTKLLVSGKQRPISDRDRHGLEEYLDDLKRRGQKWKSID